MIKFFRKIRQKLLTENSSASPAGKFSRYLFYAIGEIILVVIGILIALQVNNWNNDRFNRQEAKVSRQTIHNEFINNQLILGKTIELYKSSFNASLSLVDLMGADKNELLKHNLDSLFNSSLEMDFYFPSSKSFDNLVQSGSMKLLESEELKNTLMEWVVLMEQIRNYDELITNWQYSHLMPYLANTISFKQMNIYNQKVYGGKTKIKTDYYPLFQDIKLENLLNNYLYLLQFSIDQFDYLESVQQKIIDLTVE